MTSRRGLRIVFHVTLPAYAGSRMAVGSFEPITWPLPRSPKTVKTLTHDSAHDWEEVGAQLKTSTRPDVLTSTCGSTTLRHLILTS